MKNKQKVLIGLLFVTIVVSFSFQTRFFEIAKQIEIYTTLFKELNMYYVNEINPAELTNKAIKNTLKDLDPYTSYYDEQQVEDAKIRREGEYGGIGASVYYGKGKMILTEIYKNYAADKIGLKAGDILTSVNNQELKNLDRSFMSSLLKGIPGSDISIEILRQGKPMSFKFKREKIIVNPVPFYEMIDAETGYITLTRFNAKASSEVKKAYLSLREKGMKKLVFDLRFNPGGSLFESIAISNFFLPKGSKIVSTKAKIKKLSNTYKGNREPLDLEIPIVVLINGRSASASEIVSGALQDYDRAVILGERSFGKGLVQRQKELAYGSQLKVTISKYYTPSGRCIQELDYANRDSKSGKVPKFSDSGVNEFKTKNGRSVFDGGGVTPDVKIEISNKTEATKRLLRSQAIFNFVTDYMYKNKNLVVNTSFKFSNRNFKEFQNYLKLTDTTFLSKQEQLFKTAYQSVNDKKEVSKEYQKIKNQLAENKIKEISKNKDILVDLIQDDIIERALYKKGVYQYHLKNDVAILKAAQLLRNQKQYTNLLSNQ
ncbi:MAG: S41 family peptidase [Flavobacteriaceae bacterium]